MSKGVKFNWNLLVDIRLYLMNFDTIETDVNGGVRFDREHYKKVLNAKNERGKSN